MFPSHDLAEWERLFSDELGRVTIVNSGNWSTVAGQPIEEADRFKGYAYPDGSDNIYAVRGSVTLPITRPASPIGDSRFYLASAVNIAKMRTDSASQIDLVYDRDWFSGIVINSGSMTAKKAIWYNGKFYSIGTDNGFTSTDFEADLLDGKFETVEIVTSLKKKNYQQLSDFFVKLNLKQDVKICCQGDSLT